ncbi:MAG TPA: glycosyltransferase family 1 protein [Candidatus Avipropionibacterium avicola]|uniref:Glycosyltransferase family 1 protein n=1 Tax=Candidatus Avipropionibacterium avicola TaxID=2840701 RepID=A0A9D1KM01_9ACTN|nr:glycosyltransferase family 1 protein [Candidatus Avipropionibacterium avicola]
MRVVVVSESFLPHVNGVTHSVQRLLEHLRVSGHQAVVVAPSYGPDEPTECEGFEVVRLPSLGLPGYREVRVAPAGRSRLERLLVDFAPDVMHLAAPFVTCHPAVQLGRRLGIAMVSIYQTDVPSYAARYQMAAAEPMLWRWVRHLHNLTDLTLAPSRFSADQLSAHGVERVGLWGRGVDTTRFHPGKADRVWRARMAPHGERIILYVGRLAAEKQVEDLAELTTLPGTRLVVIGDGPRRKVLEAQLPDAVFLGQQTGEAVPTAMASADLFVHTGELETFGQTIQEALASGTPVIAPARGGPLDLVRPSHNGWLYPPGDLRTGRQQVQDLLGDERKRQAFATSARAGVTGRTWSAVCDELLGHYRATVSRASSRAVVGAHHRMVGGKNSAIRSS